MKRTVKLTDLAHPRRWLFGNSLTNEQYAVERIKFALRMARLARGYADGDFEIENPDGTRVKVTHEIA